MEINRLANLGRLSLQTLPHICERCASVSPVKGGKTRIECVMHAGGRKTENSFFGRRVHFDCRDGDAFSLPVCRFLRLELHRIFADTNTFVSRVFTMFRRRKNIGFLSWKKLSFHQRISPGLCATKKDFQRELCVVRRQNAITRTLPESDWTQWEAGNVLLSLGLRINGLKIVCVRLLSRQPALWRSSVDSFCSIKTLLILPSNHVIMSV